MTNQMASFFSFGTVFAGFIYKNKTQIKRKTYYYRIESFSYRDKVFLW